MWLALSMRPRRIVLIGVLAGAVVAAGAAVVWRVHTAGRPRPGDTVSLLGGRLEFRMPRTSVPSPPAGSRTATVWVDPDRMPGSRSFMVDGHRFVRTRLPGQANQPGETEVSGGVGGGRSVLLICIEKDDPELIRAGCDQVIDTLHVRR
jgi:hypothetical protein